jgi:galacturan 1,4-alpha-galacturonidase
MKSLSVALAFATSLVSASAIAFPSSDIAPSLSDVAPRSEIDSLQDSLLPRNNHKKDNWGNAVEKDRKKVTIRASKDDHDDVSDDFLVAIKKANNGGLVHLKKGHKYVIGKKLDLTFLKDVYVRIDGELKVRNNAL